MIGKSEKNLKRYHLSEILGLTGINIMKSISCITKLVESHKMSHIELFVCFSDTSSLI